MPITIYVLSYNEIHKMQFMIDHYKTRFPECKIVVYDNGSDDGSPEVARQNGCAVINYTHLSGNTLNDGLHARMKSSIWKEATTDWVIVSDLDELIDLTEEELKQEEITGTTILKTEAYTLVNMGNDYDLGAMKHGLRDGGYDKKVCFNKKFISDINFSVGCHSANPIGTVKFSDKAYIIHHYRDLNEDHVVKKSQATARRMSADNKRYGWGIQCMRSEDELRKDYHRQQSIAVLIPARRSNEEILESRKQKEN